MLTALGVTGAAEDPLLDIVISNVQYRVQNKTNRKDMPEGLVSVAVYMAVGEYLNMKKVSGQLEGFDLEAAIKANSGRRYQHGFCHWGWEFDP